MARPRSPTYDDQRDEILRAAARLFATRGYTAATMQQVAAASGVGNPTLYHCVRDKHDLLAQIAAGQVARLEAVVADVAALRLAPEAHLRELIVRFVRAYASAENAHRVLTEDVKFLGEAERDAVVAAQRRVVAAFARAVGVLRPDLRPIDGALALLLFGMINWTFTWLKADGALTHETLAPIVADLYFGGLPAVRRQAARATKAALSA